jgi:hypothetical protein
MRACLADGVGPAKVALYGLIRLRACGMNRRGASPEGNLRRLLNWRDPLGTFIDRYL